MRNKLEIIYQRLLEAKLDENILCSEYWKKILWLRTHFSEETSWKMLTENIIWMINTKILSTTDLLAWFSETELNQHHIYSKGNHKVIDARATGIGTAKIKAMGHSFIVLFEKAQCKAYDTTFVKGFDHSHFVLNNCVGEAYEHCTFEAKDFSKVESWDNAKGTKSGASVVLER